ncbi:MAG: hypothetical protein WCD75_13785, partial [Rhodoplanes sp.]
SCIHAPEPALRPLFAHKLHGQAASPATRTQVRMQAARYRKRDLLASGATTMIAIARTDQIGLNWSTQAWGIEASATLSGSP